MRKDDKQRGILNIVFVIPELDGSDEISGGLWAFMSNMGSIFASEGYNVDIIHVTSQPTEVCCYNRIHLYNTYVNKKLWNETDRLLTFVCSNEFQAKDF